MDNQLGPVSENGKPKFTGTVAECLKHYGDSIGDDFEARRVFAKLVGVSGDTPRIWFKYSQAPVGMIQVRLRFILQKLGYDVVELRTIHPTIRQFAKHLAFELCPMEEAEKLLDIIKQSIYRIILGSSGTMDEKIELMQLYVSEHEQQLVEFEKNLDVSGAISEPSPYISQEEFDKIKAREEINLEFTSVTDDGKKIMVESFLGLIRAMRPIARFLSSDVVTAEEREIIRQKVGQYAIFDLKNDLVKLCGERARIHV